MKKTLILFAAAVLLLCTTACTSSDKKASGTVTAPSAASQPADVSVIGSTQGGVYTNEYFGLGCTLDEVWTISSKEEILALLNSAAQASTDADLAQMLKESGSMYDLYALADEGLVTLNIIIEDMGLLYGNTMSEEEYVSIAVGQLVPALEAVGYTNATVQQTTHTFAGASHSGTVLYAELEGAPFYEQQVCLKKGNYMMIVTAVSYFEDITADILAMFHTI